MSARMHGCVFVYVFHVLRLCTCIDALEVSDHIALEVSDHILCISMYSIYLILNALTSNVRPSAPK